MCPYPSYCCPTSSFKHTLKIPECFVSSADLAILAIDWLCCTHTSKLSKLYWPMLENDKPWPGEQLKGAVIDKGMFGQRLRQSLSKYD